MLQGAIALGFLNALRGLAAEQPVVVAIDDVQWLDPPSAFSIAFALRRLEREPVAVLMTMVAMLAAIGPARRILRIQTVEALRTEG